MKQTDIKGKTVSGVVWSLAEKVMTQGFSFVIGIVLARLLLPEDYGYVVIASTVIDIAGNLLDGGLTDVLIQRKDTDEEHSSTLLYFTLGAALLFYGIFFVSAPWISKIYDIPILVPVIRIYGLTLPITAIRTFFMALMQKDLKFKRLFVSSFAGTIIGGTLGIVMAVMNYGIWALVAYLLTDVIIDTIVMAIMLGWRPRPVFSITKLKSLLKEAFHSLGSNLATRYSSQLIELLIGVKYTAAELSFYNRGKQYPTVMCNTLNNALGSVMFPVLSDIADDSEKFKKAMRRMLKTSTYLQFPMLFGFAVVTEPLIRLVLTEKWLPAVPFIQLTCITYSFWPYITCYTKAINAKGEFGKTFKNETIVSVCRLIICGACLFISPLAVTAAHLVIWIIDSVLNGRTCNKFLKYTIGEQLKDVFPNYFCSLVMAVAVYLVGLPINNDLIKVIIQIVTGLVLFPLISFVTKNDSFNYVLSMIKSRKNRE